MSKKAREALERMRRRLDSLGEPEWAKEPGGEAARAREFEKPGEVRDPYLRAWWEGEVRGWDDPRHPFLDRDYSTPMPAVDCTPFVARAIAAREVDALVELWYWLGSAGVPALTAEMHFGHLRGSEPTEDVAFAEEGLAMHALMLRSHFSGHFPIRQYMDTALVTVGLLWPGTEGGDAASGEWTERLKRIPPMARLMVLQCFFREGEWLGVREGGRVQLRPEMCYEERCYGNNTAHNLHYADWLGCWREDIPPEAVPRSQVTKAVIMEKAARAGVELKRSWKRDRMLDACREDEVLWRSLWEGHTDRFFREDALEEFRLLAFYLEAMEPVVREYMEMQGLALVFGE